MKCTRKVISRRVSSHMIKEIYWDALEYVYCLNCEQVLESADKIHLCKVYLEVDITPCLCRTTWKDPLDFFNLDMEGTFHQCHRCTILEMPVEDWHKVKFNMFKS